jgi:hypothetical protein
MSKAAAEPFHASHATLNVKQQAKFNSLYAANTLDQLVKKFKLTKPTLIAISRGARMMQATREKVAKILGV